MKFYALPFEQFFIHNLCERLFTSKATIILTLLYNVLRSHTNWPLFTLVALEYYTFVCFGLNAILQLQAHNDTTLRKLCARGLHEEGILLLCWVRAVWLFVLLNTWKSYRKRVVQLYVLISKLSYYHNSILIGRIYPKEFFAGYLSRCQSFFAQQHSVR